MTVDPNTLAGANRERAPGNQEAGQLAEQWSLRGQHRQRSLSMSPTASYGNGEFTIGDEEGQIRIRDRNDYG
jgi:hypothetical protein